MSLSLARALDSPRVPAEFPTHLGPGREYCPGATWSQAANTYSSGSVTCNFSSRKSSCLSSGTRFHWNLFKVPNMKLGFGERWANFLGALRGVTEKPSRQEWLTLKHSVVSACLECFHAWWFFVFLWQPSGSMDCCYPHFKDGENWGLGPSQCSKPWCRTASLEDSQTLVFILVIWIFLETVANVHPGERQRNNQVRSFLQTRHRSVISTLNFPLRLTDDFLPSWMHWVGVLC